jgi:uncharacterized protein (DUF1778 family)
MLVPVKTTKQKAERFVARVTRADKRIFREAASLEGRSMATFVIAQAREAAEEIIAGRNVIRLNLEKSRRFVEAILAPPPSAHGAHEAGAEAVSPNRRLGCFTGSVRF